MAPQLRVLLHDQLISRDPRATQFCLELGDGELKNVTLFLNKAADFGFSPDQAFYIWFRIPRDEGLLRFVGGTQGALGMFMDHGGRQLFQWLSSERGMKWLLADNGENLKLFFDYMASLGARRG
jgi:hypothetical protein